MSQRTTEEIETQYQAALDYIYSFIDYSLTRNLSNLAEKFNLERMTALLKNLGNPQLAYPVIHVAGTKGKGSTSAMCASILKAAGYKTGFYISPHLQDYTERIQVNGENIPHADLVDLIAAIKPYVSAVEGLTTFEITTAAAFWYFAQRGVDAAVIEVGLGGRLDATNLVDPEVAVITSISYDHTAVLGNTLSEIAGEKGGIIKPGKPAVIAPQREEARRVLEQIARERNSPVTQVGVDTLYAAWGHNLDGQTLLLWTANEQAQVNDFIETGNRDDWSPLQVHIPLLGQHQVENAATAFTAIQLFRQKFPVSEAAVRDGFAQVEWPGRFELLNQQPPLVVNSAHNRDSALKLRIAIDDYFSDKRVLLVFGASEDKDVAGMFAELLPRVRKVIATRSIHPRAMPPEELVTLAHRMGRPAQVADPVEDALQAAWQQAGENDVIVVAGSLFVAAAARFAWQNLLLPALKIRGSLPTTR